MKIKNITITTGDFHPWRFLYFYLIPFSKHVSSCFYCNVKKKKKETSSLHQKIKGNETPYVPNSAFNNLNFIFFSINLIELYLSNFVTVRRRELSQIYTYKRRRICPYLERNILNISHKKRNDNENCHVKTRTCNIWKSWNCHTL